MKLNCEREIASRWKSFFTSQVWRMKRLLRFVVENIVVWSDGNFIERLIEARSLIYICRAMIAMTKSLSSRYIKINESNFVSIDRSLRGLAWGAVAAVAQRGYSRRSQRLRRSYRERLIAQLSRRIARSKIIFIHRNTRCTRIFVYAVHEPYDFKRAKKRLDGSELLIEVRLGLDVQLIN